MPQQMSPLAGKTPPSSLLVNIPDLLTAYYTVMPDIGVAEQRVAFGTSGHRGSSLHGSFNEAHILAMTQSICDYRLAQGIQGPLMLGIDSHALSTPTLCTTLEVLAANGTEVWLSKGEKYTPTPVISHAILTYNKKGGGGLADGIVITPSHNPPEEGGFKYNPPHGGPADPTVTRWIETRANQYLAQQLEGVKRISYQKALQADTTHHHDFRADYLNDLEQVIDMQVIRESGIVVAADPMGGAGVHYWEPLAKQYGLRLEVVSQEVDPTFRFMTLDWDGKIRMDPSSPYAMQRLLSSKGEYAVAFACDTDHDRHGIVTQSAGLLPSNHFISAAIDYLFTHRPQWHAKAGIGKTLVSSQMIDRIAAHLGRTVYEVPVGFKWFVEGLTQGWLAFVGEESAGATFVRRDGSVWTTDKDGIVASLLAAEMTARTGQDPGERYAELVSLFGHSSYIRVEGAATAEQKSRLLQLTPEAVALSDLGGEPIQAIYTKAPGNGASIGGIKVVAASGWFAVRPSGTEEIYRLYVESVQGDAHRERILRQAQAWLQQLFA